MVIESPTTTFQSFFNYLWTCRQYVVSLDEEKIIQYKQALNTTELFNMSSMDLILQKYVERDLLSLQKMSKFNTFSRKYSIPISMFHEL